MLPVMRLLVVGAGATGGHYGALACRGGADVVLVARGAHAGAIASHGLSVERPEEERFTVRPRVVVGLDELRGERFDLVLLTVKAPDLPPLLPHVAELGGTVVTAQNGVDAEPLAAAYVPPERLVAAVLHIGASVVEPGLVRVVTRDTLVIGPPDPRAAAAARAAADGLAAAGVNIRYRDDILAAKWAKLVWNNAWNVLTALTDKPIGPLVRDAETRALAMQMMAEVAEVARAEGVPLRDDVVSQSVARAEAIGDVGTSTLHDARAGRPLEFEALVGSVVRRARAHRVPTPTNDLLYVLMRARSVAR